MSQSVDKSDDRTIFCRACAREAFRAWQGWCSMGTESWRGRDREKLRLPNLPRLREGKCPECGSTEHLVPECIHYRNYHGRFNTGLPDYFELVISEQPNPEVWRWGRPYVDEGTGRIPWPEMLERIASFDGERRAVEAHDRFMQENFAGGGRNWDPGFGQSKEPEKAAPEPADVERSLATLKDRWAEIVGVELANVTQPLEFTGKRKRCLVVWADPAARPPWGSWTELSSYLPERRTFTAMRTAINAAIVPMRVDHVEFHVGVRGSEESGTNDSTQGGS